MAGAANTYNAGKVHSHRQRGDGTPAQAVVRLAQLTQEGSDSRGSGNDIGYLMRTEPSFSGT
jgi:hypothetical protein